MFRFLEQIIAALFNRLRGQGREAWPGARGVDVGLQVKDGSVTRQRVSFSNARRMMHIGVLGITGGGKSSLLKIMAGNDLMAGRSIVYFDFHGDATAYLLGFVNALERQSHKHLHDRLILIDPADAIASVGLNPLEQESPDFMRIAEIAQFLKDRWGLDHFGPRTDELLRNALFVLSVNKLTLIEVTAFLTNRVFRANCLKNVQNAEVREYFESRYDQVSPAMQAVMREPVLNKISQFCSDPKFRHLIGQQHSTFSLREAMDESRWIVVNLAKGRLGEQAFTLGGLIFTMLKNALFAREKRSLCTFYLDEIQNFLTNASSIETLLAEGRKFGVGIVSANQFLDQHPADIRAAILSAATHAFFRLSSVDANQIAQALDGGRSLAERLKNLPQRHCIIKSGADRWVEVRVPTLHEPHVDYGNLLNRLHNERTRPRVLIERDIAARQAALRRADEVLHDWE